MTKRKRIFTRDTNTLQVCPWLYYSCKLPAGEVCKLESELIEIIDVTDWIRKVSQAIKCKHLGEELTREQYENRRLGVVV